MHVKISSIDQQTSYRGDIDGLRAVAVLAVLAYHYTSPSYPGWMQIPGGFTGVDVFFVISGYLITSNISASISAGTFSILGFYDRRIRRILPALLLMLAVTLFAGKFLLIPGEYEALANSTAAAAFGVSNFFFLSHTGYFDQAADLMPLVHTWSLAVEEQFYLVWPALLFAIAAGRRRIDIAALLGGITIAGVALSLVYLDADPKGAFFMVLPRAWELVVGALLVFLPPLPKRAGEAATVLGIAVVCGGFFLVSAVAFPGTSALYPCIGSALVVWPRSCRTTAGSWLGFLSPIGLISYSLYLWHWPVRVFYRIYINNAEPRIIESVALALLSVALATLSYRFIERPFRKPRWQPANTVGAGLLGCMSVFCGAMYVVSWEGMPARAPSAYDLRSLEAMWQWTCPRTQEISGLGALCNFGVPWQTSHKKVLLWGDSHAEHMAPLINAAIGDRDVAVALYDHCPASINEAVHTYTPKLPDYYARCLASYASAVKAIRQKDFDAVILAAYWTGHLPELYNDPISPGTPAGGLSLMEAGLLHAIDDIGASARVTIVGDVPAFAADPVPCAITSVYIPRSACHGLPAISLEGHRARQGPTYDMLRRVLSERPKVNLILPAERMCDEKTCLSEIDGYFLYRDRHHIRRNLPLPVQAKLAEMIGLRQPLDD